MGMKTTTAEVFGGEYNVPVMLLPASASMSDGLLWGGTGGSRGPRSSRPPSGAPLGQSLGGSWPTDGEQPKIRPVVLKFWLVTATWPSC